MNTMIIYIFVILAMVIADSDEGRLIIVDIDTEQPNIINTVINGKVQI